MFRHMNYIYPNLLQLSGRRWFADGDGGDGDKGDKGDKSGGDSVSKADHDAIVAELEKSKGELEDLRLEVLSPEYLDWLNSSKDDKGDKGDKKEDKGEKKDELSDEALEKLTPKQILDLATKRAEDKFRGEMDDLKKSSKADRDADTKREIDAFSRQHEDFKTYRPIMYGLSLDPKNANLTLGELYAKAKDHVKGIHTETSEADKKKQQKSKSEKPGGASESYDELKKLSPDEAAKKSLEEVKGKLGEIPAA